MLVALTAQGKGEIVVSTVPTRREAGKAKMDTPGTSNMHAANATPEPITPTILFRPRSLWDIERDFLAWEEIVQEAEGDVTGVEEIVDTWLRELGDDAAKKLDGYAAFIAELNARAEARKEEASRLAHRAKVDAGLAAHLKDRAKEFLAARGWTKLETPRYRLSVCKNGGVQPVAITVPPERLPTEYQVVRVTPNTTEIGKALAAGQEIEGCELLPRGTHLRIT